MPAIFAPEEVQHLVMSYTSTCDPDCQLTCIHCFNNDFGQSEASNMMGYSGWEVFSTILKLSSRSKSITAVHLALKGHINAVWRSQRHAMLLLTGETLSASQKNLNPS